MSVNRFRIEGFTDSSGGGIDFVRAEDYDSLRAELEAERARVVDLMLAGSNLSAAVENIEGDIESVDLRMARDMADQMDEAIQRTPAQSRANGMRFHTNANKTGWPSIGELCLIRIGGVLQNEVFQFDEADTAYGGVEHFWGRDDCDECPPFDPDNDEWLPLSEIEQAARLRSEAKEKEK